MKQYALANWPPLLTIQDNYEKVVLSMDKSYVTDHEGVRFQNIIDFLLAEQE